MPEYMLTAEAMGELAGCLSDRGVAIFNLTGSLKNGLGPSRWSVVKTIRSVLPNTLLYYRRHRGATHVIVVASRRSLEHRAAPLRNVPGPFLSALSDLLDAPRPLDEEALARARVLTDDSNVFSQLNVGDALDQRRGMLGEVPVPLLVN